MTPDVIAGQAQSRRAPSTRGYPAPTSNHTLVVGAEASTRAGTDPLPAGRYRPYIRATIRQLRTTESEAWDGFVARAPDGHLLQSWGWGEFKRGYGWHPVRLGLFHEDRILAGAQVLLRSLAGFSVAYVPRGPVVPGGHPDTLRAVVGAVHRLAQSRNSIFLKLEPNERECARYWSYRAEGFVPSQLSVQARATLVVDLRGGEEAVLARMRSKTRYNIRLAERRGVLVRAAASDHDLSCFHELVLRTSERDGFQGRSPGYYRDVLNQFRPRGQAELLLAEFNGRTIAGLMVFAYGPEGIYMYGASGNEHRREMPNHLLQWRAMQWCMQKGCTRYDLWGIPESALQADGGWQGRYRDLPLRERSSTVVTEPPGEAADRPGLWGVYRFKRGFGGEPVRFVGAFDYPYIRPLYLLWSHIKKNRD